MGVVRLFMKFITYRGTYVLFRAYCLVYFVMYFCSTRLG